MITHLNRLEYIRLQVEIKLFPTRKPIREFHNYSIGISALNDITRLEQLVDKFQDDMKQKPLEDRTYLDMKLSDISSQETLAKVMALEPTGTGLQLPSVVVEGKENNRNQLYKRQRPDWKSVRIVDDETKEKFDIADWAYDEKSYPQFEGNRIALVAELGISDYKGIHVELTAKTDRAFSAELEKHIFRKRIIQHLKKVHQANGE